MVIPQLHIQTVRGKIGIHSSQAKINIHTSHAEQTIQQPKAELHVQTTPSKLTIDQTEAWNNLNLKSAFVRIRDAASAGHQAVLEGIARRVSEGDDLMHIERHGNPIIDHVRKDSMYHGKYETGHVPPMEAVKIHYQPEQVNITWQTHAPIIQATSNAPKIDYQPGAVNIYMEQYPSVTITGGQVDIQA